MGAYHRPDDLDAAIRLLAAGPVLPFAGGTDVLPADATRSAWGEPALDAPDGADLLDLSGPVTPPYSAGLSAGRGTGCSLIGQWTTAANRPSATPSHHTGS